jgi:hypothetical protein
MVNCAPRSTCIIGPVLDGRTQSTRVLKRFSQPFFFVLGVWSWPLGHHFPRDILTTFREFAPVERIPETRKFFEDYFTLDPVEQKELHWRCFAVKTVNFDSFSFFINFKHMRICTYCLKMCYLCSRILDVKQVLDRILASRFPDKFFALAAVKQTWTLPLDQPPDSQNRMGQKFQEYISRLSRETRNLV